MDEPLPGWVEELEDDEDAELTSISRKILHSQSEGDAYAVLDHYARSVRKRTHRRAVQEKFKEARKLIKDWREDAMSRSDVRAATAQGICAQDLEKCLGKEQS